jgi:rubredoxin
MTEICPDCGAELKQITAPERRPDFWGAPAYETIVVALCCPECGYWEDC